ncbi:Rv2578c family radical SAM protein [Saccharopolyspora phatthalungensis]|uniref:DNA repair photolyase n=1 Tax=Saccharopolyspora phatthalungensis TaxID=664693 RepID=A0A840Q244_9PSEU|nr:Rv2578c family radical SAM protein [Saccharopolyspora phatthalungensis]MBB5152799.1 DNA repair photolyase [Saccharopolyspora phatthalungensis]
MRWEQQRITPPAGDAPELPLAMPEPPRRDGGRAGLRLPEPVPIEAGTAESYAIEIHAKSIINRVPGAARVPFGWTINPYRGCAHACRYCFARRTHTYLDLDAGHDFDSKIVVKVNAGVLLRKELASPRWAGEAIAMGTNTDPYQRAEGRYRLMRDILAALRDRANPFSILTKGTLILRDFDLIAQAAEVAPVSVAVSIGSVDERLWRAVEPGAPSPRRRLDVVRRFADAGIGCSVLMAPILPGLSDAPEQIDATVRELAQAGAANVTPLLLHLRPGAREWFRAWLQGEHPELVPSYARLYREGSYLPKSYQREVLALVAEAKRRHGVGSSRMPEFREVGAGAARSDAEEEGVRQLSLL